MTKLTLSQATEIAIALYGPSIEMIVDHTRSVDRCRILKATYTAGWNSLRVELSHGKDWFECIQKVLPEIEYKEFHPTEYPWSQFIHDLRQVRRKSEASKTDSVRSVDATYGKQSMEN